MKRCLKCSNIVIIGQNLSRKGLSYVWAFMLTTVYRKTSACNRNFDSFTIFFNQSQKSRPVEKQSWFVIGWNSSTTFSLLQDFLNPLAECCTQLFGFILSETFPWDRLLNNFWSFGPLKIHSNLWVQKRCMLQSFS